MRRAVAGVYTALALATPCTLVAQSAPEDSAAAALRSYRAALSAHRNGRLDSALIAASAAARRWPSQTAYHATTALLSARASHSAGLIAALLQLTRAEAGADVAEDSAVKRMSEGADVRVAVSRLREATHAVPSSEPFATLSDSTLYPEGMDIDPRTGNLYVASVRHRTIVERRPDGTERELLSRRLPNVGALFGVRVDPRGDRLWATTSGVSRADGYTRGDSAIAALLEIRTGDGAIMRRWDMPVVPGGRLLGDLALLPNGDVVVTDSRNPAAYRLDRAGDSLVRYTHPLFRSLQGVAAAPDGRTVYLADYSHGLLRLDLRTGDVHVVGHAPGASVLGLDGIAYHRGSIVAVQNGVVPPRIVRYTLDASGSHVVDVRTIDRNTAIADEPTGGSLLDDWFVYVANSAWGKYDDSGARVPGTRLTRPVLLRVRLW